MRCADIKRACVCVSASHLDSHWVRVCVCVCVCEMDSFIRKSPSCFPEGHSEPGADSRCSSPLSSCHTASSSNYTVSLCVSLCVCHCVSVCASTAAACVCWWRTESEFLRVPVWSSRLSHAVRLKRPQSGCSTCGRLTHLYPVRLCASIKNQPQSWVCVSERFSF